MTGETMDKRRQFEQEAREQIAAKSHVDPSKVQLDSKLTEDLGLDSIDLAELGEDWGERYDVDFNVDDVLSVTTVWDVVETVTTKMDDDSGAAEAGA